MLLVALAAVLVRCAWIGDDGYISLRVVLNLVEGRGLTWNVDERVQVFTHPLWLLRHERGLRRDRPGCRSPSSPSSS